MVRKIVKQKRIKTINGIQIVRDCNNRIINPEELGLKPNKAGNYKGMLPSQRDAYIRNMAAIRENPEIIARLRTNNANCLKYTSVELSIKLQKYLDLCLQDKNKIPSIADLCVLLDISKDALDRYIEMFSNPEYVKNTEGEESDGFSTSIAAFKKLQTLQEARLLEQGNEKKVPIFQMFLLKAKHGYIETEKQIRETTTTHKIELVSYTPPPKPLHDKETTRIIDIEETKSADVDDIVE